MAQPYFSATLLADEFLAVLDCNSGRRFSWDRASAKDDWDHLIWDLLEHTANATVGTLRSQRGTGLLSFLTSEATTPPEDGGSDDGQLPEGYPGHPAFIGGERGSAARLTPLQLAYKVGTQLPRTCQSAFSLRTLQPLVGIWKRACLESRRFQFFHEIVETVACCSRWEEFLDRDF